MRVRIPAAFDLADAAPVDRRRVAVLLVAGDDAALAADAAAHVEVKPVLLAGPRRARRHPPVEREHAAGVDRSQARSSGHADGAASGRTSRSSSATRFSSGSVTAHSSTQDTDHSSRTPSRRKTSCLCARPGAKCETANGRVSRPAATRSRRHASLRATGERPRQASRPRRETRAGHGRASGGRYTDRAVRASERKQHGCNAVNVMLTTFVHRLPS